jgi:hypothetical protein
MNVDINPFDSAQDADRHAIWEMLVRRDIEALAANDWARHAKDFLRDGFFGIDGQRKANPDAWRATFTRLESYAQAWTEFAAASHGRLPPAQLMAAHFAAASLRDIEINGDFAIAHKKFDGAIVYSDGEVEHLDWQSLYFCRQQQGRWWICGFVGYLPNPMGSATADPA